MSYTAIDIGSGASNRSSSVTYGYTRLDRGNPANADGVLTSFSMYFDTNPSGVKMGTFYGTYPNYTNRDYESFSGISGGVVKTFTGRNCTVNSGDLLGNYYSGGELSYDNSSGPGIYRWTGDAFGAGSKSYISFDSVTLSTYAEGGTAPDPPTNVAATKNNASKVTVSWTKSTGATSYEIYRNGSLLDTVGDVSSYDDTTASAPVITPGSTIASDGDYGDKVALSLSGTSITDGETYTYTVKAVNVAGTSAESASDTGYRKAGSLSYQWMRSSADSDASYYDIWEAVTASYNYTGAPSPQITAGSAVASDGTSPYHVELSLSGTSIADGSGRYYKCEISSTGATTVTSTPDRGYRGSQALTYQWQRSAGDSDASYSDISGATTSAYNDTGAPSIGSGRYYKCKIDAEGSNPATSSADRGYRIPSLTFNDSFTLSESFSKVSSFNREFNDSFTFTEATNLSPEYDLQSIDILNFYKKMIVNSSQQIKAIGNYSSIEDQQDLTSVVTWTSSNQEVATIDANGLIITYDSGITFIRASLGGVYSIILMLEVDEASTNITEDSILQLIPITSKPNQSFNVTLNVDGKNITLGFILRWNEEAQYWVMTIYNYATNAYYIDSLPLTTGILPTANLLQPFSYMEIGSCYIVNVSNTESNYPTKDNLGIDYLMYWGDTE